MATKGIPSVPDVPTALTERDIYRILEPLKRIIDIRQGRFDPLDRWVTQQDLIDAGLQTEAAVEAPIVVVPSTSVYDFELTGDINGGPTEMASGDPLIQMDTLINLPNVTEIDGGDAAETFPSQPQGPYGVVSGGGGGVPNGGTFGQILIKQSATDGDAIWDSFGPDQANDAYYPNYTSYTRVDNDTFTIDLIDAESLFREGRRIRFEQSGAFDYGVVSSVDYNITNANDTTVNLTMEGADTVPTGVFDVALVTSATAWSPIAGDPFSGNAIRDIATGVIGATQWWVIVGDGGRVATSTDGGATWTTRTSNETGDIRTVIYDAMNQEFYFGGGDASGGFIRNSTNGTTWTDVTLSAWADGANDYIASMGYNVAGNYICVTWWDNDGNSYFGRVTDNGFTTVGNRTTSAFPPNLAAADEYASSVDTNWTYAASTSVVYFSSFADTSGATDETVGSTVTGLIRYTVPGTGTRTVAGLTNGNIELFQIGGAAVVDDVTFADPIRNFAHSDVHNRLVCVGDNATIGYIADANVASPDAWVAVQNGFDPLADILAVEFNETDGVFVAVASNGQICRSTNGTN